MSDAQLDAAALQARITAFVRAFGLHQPEQTPYGQPIPVSEAYALAELDRASPLSQAELGQRLRLQKSTVSRLVGQLLQRGWVTREKRDGDGRLVWLRLTDHGRNAAAQLAAARGARFTALLAAIPDQHRQPVIDALTVLVEAANDGRAPRRR